jgi:hypothetical protein
MTAHRAGWIMNHLARMTSIVKMTLRLGNFDSSRFRFGTSNTSTPSLNDADTLSGSI